MHNLLIAQLLLLVKSILFSPVGFKGNLSLLEIFQFFPGDLSKWRGPGLTQRPTGIPLGKVPRARTWHGPRLTITGCSSHRWGIGTGTTTRRDLAALGSTWSVFGQTQPGRLQPVTKFENHFNCLLFRLFVGVCVCTFCSMRYQRGFNALVTQREIS